MSFISNNIKAARKQKGLNQEQIAEKLGVPRSTYASWEGGANIDHDTIASIAKILGYKYRDLIDEDFIIENQLEDDEPKYKKGKKSLQDVKVVDSEVLLTQDTLQIKAMLRVMLRSQAVILAAQQRMPLKSVLAGMTKDVRAETSDEFDEL